MSLITIYVISWRWLGQPGGGIVGAYRSKEEAEKVYRVLEEHGDTLSKGFSIAVIEDVEV